MPNDSVITPEMRAAIGVASEPATHEVEAGAIRRFADAIGDPDPLYRDESAARESRYGGIIAPPTFLRSMDPDLPTAELEVPYPMVIDGGSDWEFFEPVRPGDTITVTSRVVELKERTGRLGPMLFVIRETSYVDQHDRTAAVQRSTLIYYEPQAEGGR